MKQGKRKNARLCDEHCHWWKPEGCIKKYFEVSPKSPTNYRGMCDYFQAFVIRDGIGEDIPEEQEKEMEKEMACMSNEKCVKASDVLPKVRVQFRARRRYVMERTENGTYHIIATLHAPEYAALFGAAQRMHDSLKDCIETMEYVLDDITTTEASKEMLRDSLKQAKVALKISEQ